MLVKRKDHACAFVAIGEEKGILVSGGVNEDDQLLDSVEFYSIDKDEWKEVAHLKQARTEHGKDKTFLSSLFCSAFSVWLLNVPNFMLEFVLKTLFFLHSKTFAI